MNYFNQSEWDHDTWVEMEKNTKAIDTSKKSRRGEHLITVECLPSVALGLPTASPVIPPPKEQQWAYFITLCFPTKCKFQIKHLQMSTMPRVVFSPIMYGECTQDEQYHWVVHILNKTINMICDEYDLFFEVTEAGNIHVHGRINFLYKKKTMKDVRALFHRAFGVNMGYVRFTDVKVYDASKWNNYETKQANKQYQTTQYPHFKNI